MNLLVRGCVLQHSSSHLRQDRNSMNPDGFRAANPFFTIEVPVGAWSQDHWSPEAARIRWSDGDRPESQGEECPQTQAPYGSRRARPERRAVDDLKAAWGGCAYCGATDKPLQRDCVLAISAAGVTPRQHRSSLRLMQRQQRKQRSDRLAAASGSMRAPSCSVISRSRLG